MKKILLISLILVSYLFAYSQSTVASFHLWGRYNYQIFSLPVSIDIFFMEFAHDKDYYFFDIYENKELTEKLIFLMENNEWEKTNGLGFDIVILSRILFVDEGNHYLMFSSDNRMYYRGVYYKVDFELRNFFLSLTPEEDREKFVFMSDGQE